MTETHTNGSFDLDSSQQAIRLALVRIAEPLCDKAARLRGKRLADEPLLFWPKFVIRKMSLIRRQKREINSRWYLGVI
jgi:hypothetical protein